MPRPLALLAQDAADFVAPSSPEIALPLSPIHASHEQCASSLDKVWLLYEKNKGLLLVVASQAFFALMNVAVKKLNSVDPPVPALELVLIRMVITYSCCIVYMLWKGVPDPWTGPKGVRLLLAFRGFFGFFGLFGIYYSLQYLSLSDSTVLTFLAPMCTAAAGALILKEPFSIKEALAGVFSLLGVVLIARPEFLFRAAHAPLVPSTGTDAVILPDAAERGTPAERLGAVGVALVGVLGGTGAYTTLRAIGKRAHPLHSLTSFSSQCIIASGIGMLLTREEFIVPTRLEWLGMLIMIGIFGFVAQVLLVMGFQRETAGRGTLAIYTQVIYATILERIFFHTVPSMLSIIGTVIIMTSAIYVVLTKENAGSESRNKGAETRVDDDALEEGLLDNVEEGLNDDGWKTPDADAKKVNGVDGGN